MRHSKPVRLETAPTGPDRSGSKSRGESVYLFFEFKINQNARTLRRKEEKTRERETECLAKV